MQLPTGGSDSSIITEPSFETQGTTLAHVSVGGREPATGCHIFLSRRASLHLSERLPIREISTTISQVMQSTRRSKELVYIDPEKFLELVAHSKKTERDLCASAGISKAVFDRLLRHGGPVKLSTLTKITTALRVSVTSLVVQRRRQ